MNRQKNERAAGDLLELELKDVKWKFRWCPAGTFIMGSPESEGGRCDNETRHKVTLTQGFWLGETQVTQEQWQAMMGNNPSEFEGASLPVDSVSWDDCQEFIAQLNAQNATPAGFRFSLPTEAQWEYACRAGTQTAYCFGDDINKLVDYAWYSGHKDFDEWENSKEYKNSKFSKLGCTTHEIGTKEKNAWGLYDMHGNVYEWCEDWYEEDYPKGDVVDPIGASSSDCRVNRGGSWILSADSCRSACRYYNTLEKQDVDLGLRVALRGENE